ncbi:MAG TPA: MFS transporter [Actinomycetota bacterium]
MEVREPVEGLGGLRAAVSLVRRNRDFRNLYVASLISLGGDWFLIVALFGLALDLTGSAVSVAALIAAQELPFFLMSPVGGLLTDRLDRRWLMITCDAVRAVLCLGFLLVRDAGSIWAAYLLLATISSFSAAFQPATSAAFPNLVEPRDLGPANALFGSLWGTMLAVGAALGGIVAAALGRDAAFLIDAGTFLVSGLLIARIRRPMSELRTEEPERNVVRATTETVRYARRDRRVLALLGVKAGFGLAAGVLVLIAVLAREEFEAGDVGIGILMSARGVGALIGPFLGRRLAGPQDRRLFAAIGFALGVFGVGYVLVGVMPVLWLAAAAITFAHLGGGAQWTLSTYGLQRIVPDRIRGRIFAFDAALITLTLTVSSLVTGWTAQTFGARPTTTVLGVVAVGWAVAWTWLSTGVRRATMFQGCGPPTPADGADETLVP